MGTVLRPYSVSPRLRDQSVGPKPTMYWVTFTPNFLAGTMWPTSCSAMEASRPSAKTSTPTEYNSQAGTVARSSQAPRTVSSASAAARSRAHASACSTSSTVPGFPTVAWRSLSHSPSTAAIVSTICRNATFPAWKAATSASLAALYTAGAQPPAAPARRARSTAGNATGSSGSNVHPWATAQSTPAAASGTRSGQPSASEIGSRMSGGEAWAMVEPSLNSTIEWMIDCGWTTTWMRSYGMSKSRCASMTSSPLLTSVAELVVT